MNVKQNPQCSFKFKKVDNSRVAPLGRLRLLLGSGPFSVADPGPAPARTIFPDLNKGPHCRSNLNHFI